MHYSNKTTILLLILLSNSLFALKDKNNEKLKSLIKVYSEYSRFLDNGFMISNLPKRKQVIMKLQLVKNELKRYLKNNKENQLKFSKILHQLENEERNFNKKNNKMKSASDSINSITGFWG